MSRGPDTQTVNQLHKTLQLYRMAMKQLRLAQAAASTIPKLEADVNTHGRDVIKLLESMDCKAYGNFGWEVRIVMMLAELTDIL